jgi:hypothetical protein
MGKESLRVSDNNTETGTSLAELQLKLAAYILAQEDYHRTTDVHNILAETKVGAWRRQTLLNKLRIIFSAG